MRHLEDVFATKIPEYTICAKRCEDGEFYHCWYLGADMEHADGDSLAKSLDDFLMEANKNDKVDRGKSLKGVKVRVVATDLFYEWNVKNKKKGGQVKIERVMNEEKFADWERFNLSKVPIEN